MKRFRIHIKYGILASISMLMLFCSSYNKSVVSQEVKGKTVIKTFIKDTVPVEVDLLFDSNSNPDRYYSYIVTPVCEEGICYDLKVHLYWDLLGYFIKYEEVPGDPFTKYEHEKLAEEDHIKLRKILKDKTSPLANYTPENLVDDKKTTYSPVIDGVVGATYPALKDEVVSGAVYSTHTLWNIVNGSLADSIQAYTEKIVDHNMLVNMIQSNSYDLQMYGMRHLSPSSDNYSKLLISLVEHGKSHVPFFAIAKIPQAAWQDKAQQSTLVAMIKKQNFEMQNEILNALIKVKIHPSNGGLLLDQIDSLKENQYDKVIQILKAQYASLDRKTHNRLKRLSQDSTQAFASYASRLINQEE